MSSVLKPSLTASVSQNSTVPPQLNKPMHPQQGPPQSYGQPSNHHSMMSHGSPTAAHNHPTTHQPNHYSLNVPNASGHYMGNNQPIPASNHPIPNNPSQPSSQQLYGGAKNMAYQGGYQPNLGHPPNSANQLPPVSQTLPATNSQPTQHHAEELTDRSQSNGTNEEKSSLSQENHVTTPKEISNTPALPNQSPTQDKKNSPERSSDSHMSPEQDKPVDLDTSNTSTPQSSSSTESLVQAVQKSPQTNVQDSHGNKSSESPNTDVTQETSKEVSDTETDDLKSSEIEEDTKSSNISEERSVKEASSNPSESANKSSDNLKDNPVAADHDSKEKTPTAPKSRGATRKPSRTNKNEEESPKTPRSEPKPSPSQKSPSTSKSKRARIRTQPYQSPLPELEIISKISASSSQRNKTNDEKLIVFFKNEFLAVRNSEGSFYICQAVQNVYKSSAKIRIRWLSQDKNDKNNQIYTPDFYDNTDFDCILTNLNLERVEKGKFRLPPAEKERTDSILNRSLAAEKGEEIPSPTVTEEHPDGLDLSLYKDENQLNKQKGKKRKATSPVKSPKSDNSQSPVRKSPEKSKVAKVTPKSTKKVPAKKDTPAPVKQVVPATTSTPKKSVGSRTERAKRRSDTVNSTKVSPVSPKVDQKKAKALAKVARKSAVPSPKPQQTPAKKEAKPTKSATPVKAKPTVKTATPSSSKKITPKRSLRK